MFGVVEKRDSMYHTKHAIEILIILGRYAPQPPQTLPHNQNVENTGVAFVKRANERNYLFEI